MIESKREQGTFIRIPSETINQVEITDKEKTVAWLCNLVMKSYGKSSKRVIVTR